MLCCVNEDAPRDHDADAVACWLRRVARRFNHDADAHAGAFRFLSQFDLDYVSCSPFRVPIARLACAQAEIAKKLRNPNASG